MGRLFLILLTLAFATSRVAAQTVTYESSVVDGSTGEPLPLASVRAGNDNATLTNSEGCFSIKAAPEDTIWASFVGYETKAIPASKLGESIMLSPASVRLAGVEVEPISKRLERIIGEALKQLRKNSKRTRNYFYRQTTKVDGSTTSMVEAFVSARSAYGVSRTRLITGRYADSEQISKGVKTHSANLLPLSETAMACDAFKFGYYDFISPLSWGYKRYYDVGLDIMDNGRQTIYAIHFKPVKEYGRRMLFSGTLYVDAGDSRVLRADGKLLNFRIISSFGLGQLNAVEANIDITIDYDYANGFCEAGAVGVRTSFVNEGSKVCFSSVLYHVDGMQAQGQKRTKPATDLRQQIDELGYDADFWKQTEIFKRTDGEAALARQLDSTGPQRRTSNTAKARSAGTFAANIDRFNRLFPQEKAYLHFDNTAYFRGETIWFSAYVVRADRQRLTDMSRVLYVELLDPTGEVVETRKVRLDGGRGSGSFRLDRLLTSGFYEVRAYTRYMLNWDAAWCFSRVLPVFDEPEQEGDYSRPKIAEPVYRKRLPSSRQVDSTLQERVNVAFYPEGGRLVGGLPSRVAFAVTDKDGRPVEAEGTLAMADGSTEAVKTLREGRGTFAYKPAQMPAKLTLTTADGNKATAELPAADAEGCAMEVDAVGDHYVNIAVRRSAGFAAPLAMALVSGGNVEAVDTIAPSERVARRRLAKADMTPGVNQIALIAPDGSIVAERMVFVYPQDGVGEIKFTPEGSLSPCGKLALKAKTEPGATFSVAVRDAASELNGSQGDAATWLLLASDLRGYIHNPEYYFEADDSTHRRAADLLMMVQGWRRYDLAQMDGTEAFVRRHPIEDRLYLYGQLRRAKKKLTVDNVSLTATLYNRAGESMRGRATTDSTGNYAFSLPDCEGEWTLLLNTAKDGEAAKYRIGIDRNFSPLPRPLSPLETERTEADAPTLHTSAEAAFDSIEAALPMDERVHVIKEVKVKGKRIFENARAAWENEQRGAYYSNIKYDCDKAADEIYDSGEDMPTIFEWLESKNNFFGGSAAEMETIISDTLEDKRSRVREDSKVMPTSLILGNIDTTPGGGNGINFDVEDDDPKWLELYKKEAALGHMLFTQHSGMTYKRRPIVWILNNAFYTVTQASSSLKYEDFDAEEVNSMTKELMGTSLEEFKSVYISEDENVWKRYLSINNSALRTPVTVFLYSHHTFPPQQKGTRRTFFEGYSKVATFQMPDYSLMPKEVDHRRTLYWNPAVKADRRGEATIEFYNNSSCRQITVSAEGITDDGQPVVYR